jgi:hypothetical protein
MLLCAGSKLNANVRAINTDRTDGAITDPQLLILLQQKFGEDLFTAQADLAYLELRFIGSLPQRVLKLGNRVAKQHWTCKQSTPESCCTIFFVVSSSDIVESLYTPKIQTNFEKSCWRLRIASSMNTNALFPL